MVTTIQGATDIPAVVNPPAIQAIGPGAELTRLIPSALAKHGCGCKDYAAKMDRWGVDGCEARFSEIVDHLVEQAAKGHIPELISRPVAKAWLRKAIDAAKSIEPKQQMPQSERLDIDAIRADPFARIDEVSLVTFHYNPEKYDRLRQTYYEWLPTLGPLAKSLRCYEMVLDDDEPEIDGSTVIRGTRAKHSLWQKEAIINRALRDTPAGVNYFAWIDHDMVIDRRDWLADAVGQIDDGSPAVQLVGELHYLDRHGVASPSRTSGMKNYRTTGNYPGNPGGAWIASVDYLRSVGGLDTGNIIGGGDQVFFDAMVGKAGWHVSQYPPALAESVTRWIASASQARYGREAGYVDCDVYHLWHGDRVNRQYGDRNKILMAGGYDPAIDTRLNDDGLLEWCSDKPEMHAGVAGYFASRREDG